MKRIYTVASGLTLALISANVLLYLYKPLGENFYIIGDSLVAALALLAVLAGFYAFRPHGLKSVQGRALFFVTAGVFFWFLGELAWGIYEIALGIKPVVSAADIFWFIGYPMFILGLYYVSKISSVALGKKKLAVFVAAIIVVFSSIIYLTIPTLIDAIPLEEKIVTAGYAIGDSVLIIGIIFVIICLFDSRFARPWSIILLSIVASTIADIYYMYFFTAYETGNLIDILWNTNYILFTLGCIYHRETVKDIVSASGIGIKAVGSTTKETMTAAKDRKSKI